MVDPRTSTITTHVPRAFRPTYLDDCISQVFELLPKSTVILDLNDVLKFELG